MGFPAGREDQLPCPRGLRISRDSGEGADDADADRELHPDRIWTSDLDAVNETLFAFGTDGGEEYVARAITTSVNELGWSDNPDALKILFVAGNEDAMQFVSSLAGDRYRGVSVIASDGDALCYASNRGDEPTCLAPGIYGLSNASLDTPWSKLTRTKEVLTALIDSNDVNTTGLLRLLGDKTLAPSAQVDSSELPFKLARTLTAPFIVSDNYGTRCSTVLLFANDGRVDFCERRFDPGGARCGDSNFSFSCE